MQVMRELVRHDLQQQLDTATGLAAELRALGQRFLQWGELDRRLVPWLWRELKPSVAEKPEQIDFLLSLLTRNGVLTAVPRSQPARWLLPMRLPLRCAPHLTSVWLRNLPVFAYTREGSMSFNRCVANIRH